MMRGMPQEQLEELRKTPAYVGMADGQVEAKFHKLSERSSAALISALLDQAAEAGLRVEVTYL